MGQIVLEGMEFFAHHGCSDEEQKIGNKYRVDVIIEADLEPSAQSDKLTDTVDYSKVYQVVAGEMKTSSRLLENVAHRIIEKLKSEFLGIEKVKVQVSKFNPPLGGLVYRSQIVLEKDFE